MAATKRKFSAVAGISLCSVLFLLVSYTRIKAPLSAQNVAIQDEGRRGVAIASLQGEAVIYRSSDSPLPSRPNNSSPPRIHRPEQSLQATTSLKQYIRQNRHSLLKNNDRNTNYLGKNDASLQETIHFTNVSDLIGSSGQTSGSEVIAVSETENSIEDEVYDGQATTRGSIEASSVTDGQRLRIGDLDNRPYRYWLSENPSLPYNTSLVTRQQINRHKQIRKTCEKQDIKDILYSPRDGHRSLISSYNNLLYCPILKAGSTNILRLLCWLYGPPCSTIKNLFPHNMVPHFLARASKIAVGNTPEFLSYFSFALVRNPWKRLVSVYIQKFVETRQGLGFCDIKRRFPAVYRYYRQHRNERMPFKDYIERCVIGQHRKGGILAQNGHWRPQYHMCSFCHLDFTFIGKIETMKADERVILNAFGFEDIDATIADANSHLLPNEKANKTKLLYEDLWAQITPKSLKYLQGLYSIDIEMFDYPSHPLENSMSIAT